MKIRQSKTGVLIAGMYVLLASALSSPLLREGYIGHGNGVPFLAATVLTSPLSFALFLLNDLLTETNAFYMTGWPYVITLCQLAAGAVLNARLIYLAVTYARRKRQKPRI